MFSQISVIGNVGRDPQVRKLQDGAIVANFSVAVNDKYTRNGVKYEATHWFNVDVWQNGENGLVDIVQKYVRAGTQVFVQGRPIIQEYEDKTSGEKKQSFRIRLGGPSAQLRLLGQPKERPPLEATPEEAEVGETAKPFAPGADPSAPVDEAAATPPRANGRNRKGALPPATTNAANNDVPF